MASKDDVVRYISNNFRFSNKCEISQSDALAIVEKVCEFIALNLENGEKVRLPPLGTFEVKRQSERTARNLKSNEPIILPARKTPTFTPSKVLKTRTNKE